MLQRQDAPLAMAVVVLACGPVVGDGGDTSGTDGGATVSPTSSAPDEASTTPLDDGDDDDAPPKFDMPHGDDSTSGGEPMTIPDCPSFDPGRVYLHGTLQEGAAYAEALADPLDPENFCVGFWSTIAVGIRPTDGRVIHIEIDPDNNMREFEPDPIGINEYGYWDLPLDPYGNDPILLPSPCDAVPQTSLWGLAMSPQGEAFYSCAYHWFDPNGVPLPAAQSMDLIAITASGEVVMFDEAGSEVYVVMPGEMLGVPLELPRDVQYVYAGRAYDGGLWLVASDVSRTLYRWTLLEGELVEDGVYSDSPTGRATLQLHSGAIDAEGDFWHTVLFAEDSLIDGIVRRRLEPEPSEVVYREDQEPTPPVKIHGSRLFTGP